MDLILDTCGLLSLTGLAKKRLSKVALSKIERAGSLYISACSFFEIAIKLKKGNLPVTPFETPIEFWETALREYQLEEIPVSSKAFFNASELPDIHSDPFDRIIIAEAIAKKIPVVTYDSVFCNYGINIIC